MDSSSSLDWASGPPSFFYIQCRPALASVPAALPDFGDSFTYALAREKREPVLWKGEDFGHTDLRAS
jgi:hypothetical protein